MLYKQQLVTGLVLAACTGLSVAHTTTIDTDFFTGTWETDPDKKCGDKNAEYLSIKKNGTFEYGRRGVAEAVGFWKQQDETISFEMLAAPASFQDIIGELEPFTTHHAWSMQLLPVETKDSQFTAVFSFGEKMTSLTWKRCK